MWTTLCEGPRCSHVWLCELLSVKVRGVLRWTTVWRSEGFSGVTVWSTLCEGPRCSQVNYCLKVRGVLRYDCVNYSLWRSEVFSGVTVCSTVCEGPKCSQVWLCEVLSVKVRGRSLWAQTSFRFTRFQLCWNVFFELLMIRCWLSPSMKSGLVPHVSFTLALTPAVITHCLAWSAAETSSNCLWSRIWLVQIVLWC